MNWATRVKRYADQPPGRYVAYVKTQDMGTFPIRFDKLDHNAHMDMVMFSRGDDVIGGVANGTFLFIEEDLVESISVEERMEEVLEEKQNERILNQRYKRLFEHGEDASPTNNPSPPNH